MLPGYDDWKTTEPDDAIPIEEERGWEDDEKPCGICGHGPAVIDGACAQCDADLRKALRDEPEGLPF